MSNLKKSFLMGAAAAGAALFASAFFSILAVHAACTNPATIPTGFAAPCPVFSLSSTSVTQAQTLTLSATPQVGTDYIYTTAYVSEGTAWNPYTLAGNNAYPSYSSALASLTLSSTQLQSLTLGTHYALVWDWLWDATANCYKGPGLNQCNTGAWRVQSFSLTSSATPTPTPTPSPYTYSQSSYYAYSQSAYTGGSTPFTGTPYPIPGKIEAENYDKGGEGVAYHDTDATNNGGLYRTTEGVDIEASTDTNGGYNVGWTLAGEWLNYTVNVQTAGSYTVTVRVACGGAGGTFHLTLDGASLGSEFTVPNTGGWQTWTTLTQTVSLPSTGQHVLRLVEDTTGASSNVGNFNWLQFSNGTNYTYSQSAYYAYSQSSYYAYSQSAYSNLPNNSYTTNFPLTENPISEGGVWFNGKTDGLDWNNIKTTGGTPGLAQTAQTLSSSGFDDGTALVKGTWGPDQTVTITAKAPSSLGGTQEVEIRLRSTLTAHKSTGYEMDFTKGGLYIVRWNGPGPFTSTCCWTTLASANVVWQGGDVLKASIIGTVITVYRNGTQVLTHDTAGDTAPTDGSGGAARYSSGYPGFGIDINSATVATDFGITNFTATGSGGSYTYSQSSYYVYSQSSYYAYSQSSYTSYAYSQSAYTGTTLTAATCSSSDVQAKINLAAAGYTVMVPAGNCSWSGILVNKAITLLGAGTGQTNISITGLNGFHVQKQTTGVIRIRGFSFTAATGNVDTSAILVDEGGTWRTDYPAVFQYNTFTANSSQVFHIGPPGGVIIAHNTFTGTSGVTGGDEFIHVYDISDSAGSWSLPDTMGTRDAATTLSGTIPGTTGFLNLYVEDNTFNGANTLGSDNDDGARIVYRHNTYTNANLNSHGDYSSPYGIRHWEIYSNTFLNTCSEASSQNSTTCPNITNQQNHIWLKGGTGVIYNNIFDNLNTGYWGGKSEIVFNIEACTAPWPMMRQLGQNYSTSQFTDPVYMWGNSVQNGDHHLDVYKGWLYSCSLNITDYFQSPRDYIDNDTGSGSGTNASKPGYTPYTYPHPLAG